MKTVSVREMSHEGVSKIIRAAQQEPVLVRQRDRPAVWMVSAERLADLARGRTSEAGIYDHALEALAVHLFDQGVLSGGQAARLLGVPLGDFFLLCDRLQIPVLREPDGDVGAEVDAFERWLESQATTA